MKIDSTFCLLVFFMAVLVFSTPMIALAQQNSERAEAVAAAERDAKADIKQGVWGAVGFLCGAGTVLVAYFAQAPPAARFVGKSPEYIQIYTQTYKAKVRNRQTGPAVLGCLAGTLAFYLYVSISEQ
ncbi:hypothetical protein F4Z99_10365 [Candidatus Poribacteria bacterium]|nr:hypothetical protein [Candidatus Poribacteria bacterium]MYA98100.1 hypothetical protein [Candidatus Poribacteria bacterium]